MLSSFRQSDWSWDLFIFQFQIARIAIRTDVKSAKMTVMFRPFIFLSKLTVTELAGCSRSILQLLLRR